MFGFLDDIVDSVSETVSDFVEDPIGTTVNKAVDITLAPVVNTLDIVDGLTEGEVRLKAVACLGADVAGAMGTSELIDWYNAK